jgi:hypothetical protein
MTKRGTKGAHTHEDLTALTGRTGKRDIEGLTCSTADRFCTVLCGGRHCQAWVILRSGRLHSHCLEESFQAGLCLFAEGVIGISHQRSSRHLGRKEAPVMQASLITMRCVLLSQHNAAPDLHHNAHFREAPSTRAHDGGDRRHDSCTTALHRSCPTASHECHAGVTRPYDNRQP